MNYKLKFKEHYVKLNQNYKLQRRFVDDTICFAKMDPLNYTSLTINSFHQNIKFTLGIEQNSAIPFLEILLIRTLQKIHRTIYLYIQENK